MKELYKEIAEKISTIDGIEWIDLWHNQVQFLEDEHPFPSPAVFLNIRSDSISDVSEKVQKVNFQIDVYLFYETFADTYKGAWNQDSALAFLDLLEQVHTLLHGSNGTHYAEMRRIGIVPVDTGTAQNLYMQTFTCSMLDYGASKVYEEQQVNDIEIERGIPDFTL